ncbi:MAG: 30S ribosome-binding factor RbfA [Desulfatiglandaceae bacterium]|jgi:ribosome-binding factor A
MLSGRRASRVGEQILKELAFSLLEKVNDPRVGTVTLTGIQLSNDLKQAKIYYSVMGEQDQIAKAGEGLESAKGFIKREVGHRLKLRYVPEMRFIHDPSLAFGSHMEKVLDEIADDE